MECPRCRSTKVHIEFVNSGSSMRARGNGVLGNTNNAARGFTALGTLGMSNLVWKKSKGGISQHNYTQKMALCQNCGHSWTVWREYLRNLFKKKKKKNHMTNGRYNQSYQGDPLSPPHNNPYAPQGDDFASGGDYQSHNAGQLEPHNEESKAKKYLGLGAAGLLLFLLGVGCGSISNNNEDDSDKTANSSVEQSVESSAAPEPVETQPEEQDVPPPATPAPEGDNGVSPVGEDDVDPNLNVGINQTATMSRMDVMVSNLRTAPPDVFGQAHVCADAQLRNKGEKDLRISLSDWRIKDPSGVTRNASFTGGSTMETVELSPGGQYSGVVCFPSEGAPGEYEISFQEGFIGGLATWKGAL